MRHRLLGLLVGATLVASACGTGHHIRSHHRSRRPRIRRRRPAAARRPSQGRERRSTCSHGLRARGRRRTAARSSSATGRKPTSSTRTTSASRPRRTSRRRPGRPSSSSPTTTVRARTWPPTIPTVDNGGVKVPGDGGDAMTVTWTLRDGLKWSDGEPLTCDDFKYAWEWVLDPDNVGVVTDRLRRTSARFDCPSDTEMVLALQEHLRGLHHPHDRAAAAPLSSRRSRSRTRSTARASGADEVANLPVSGAFKFESVTPQQELRLAKNPNYTSFATGKPAHLDTLIFKWYGDADLMIAGLQGRRGRLRDRPPGLATCRRSRTSATRCRRSRPCSTSSFARTGPTDRSTRPRRSVAARATRPSPTAAPAARWPTRQCARPSPSRSTRTRSTRGSWAAPSRSPTRASRPVPGSSRTRRRRPSIRPRPRRSSTRPAGWSAPTASARRTA